jgi:hypothetical protein
MALYNSGPCINHASLAKAATTVSSIIEATLSSRCITSYAKGLAGLRLRQPNLEIRVNSHKTSPASVQASGLRSG